MELLYHCSPTPGLTVLRPNAAELFSKPQQVCLTSLLPMALMYGAKHFEYTYGYTRDGRIYFEEYYPNALEEIYRGKTASLYLCARRKDMIATAIPYEYVTPDPVPVLEERVIPDVCEALLEQERLGMLTVVRHRQQTEKMREWVIRTAKDTILKNSLLSADSDFARFMRDKYPTSWELAEKEMGK